MSDDPQTTPDEGESEKGAITLEVHDSNIGAGSDFTNDEE